MSNWNVLPDDTVIDQTIQALINRGITAEVLDTGEMAKERVLSLIPEGAEVMTMTSVTNNTIGLAQELDESGKYNSIRDRLKTMDRNTQSLEMQKLGAAPQYSTGSVHAVTTSGEILIASNTGSQLSAYVYGSLHVFWVVGAQKIVKTLNEGMQRIQEYILPLETVRLEKQYNKTDLKSNISKMLIINKEVRPNRLHIIFVKEVLGF